MRRVFVLVGLLAWSPMSISRADGPSEGDLDLAKAHYRTGTLYFEQKKFSDAAKEFEEAYRLSKRGELLYNMGKCYDAEGNLRGALDVYRQFLATVPQSPDRAFCQQRVDELTKIVARIDLRASVAGARISLDGAKVGLAPLSPSIVEVNPGVHNVEIAAEGYATFHRDVKVERSQTALVDATLVSLVKVIRVPEHYVPVYKRWYLWTAVGVVVAAGVVTGAVLGARHASEIDGPQLQLPSVK